jgi:hypothetical protein
MAPPTRVFVSYSHESDEHSSRVLELTTRLREDGVDAWIDRYTESPSEGWPRWTHNQIDAANFVICVCSAAYREAFEGRSDPDRGLGVNAEGYAILQDLYDRGSISEKYIPVLFSLFRGGQDWRSSIPSALRGFTSYAMPGEYEEVLQRVTGRSALSPAIQQLDRLKPAAALSARGFADQAEISEYLRPEAYPLERLAPTEGLFISRLINAFNDVPGGSTTKADWSNDDTVMTVWIASRGDRQYVLDSARIYDDPRGGAGPLAEVAMPPDAKYRFTFHDGSDAELALDPALSIGPQTRNIASFTVSLAPDRPIYFFGDVWVWIRYHASDGRQGSLVLAVPFEPGRVLAKLVGQDVLIAKPAGRQVVGMVVTPDGLQRGLEEGYEPALQLEFPERLELPEVGGFRGGIGAEQLQQLNITRVRWRDLILRRDALHRKLAASDRLTELAAELDQGKLWAADVLGGMATDSATALLDARLENDTDDGVAFYGLCIRHLARPDGKLAAYVIANYENLGPYGPLRTAAAVMVLAPTGDLIGMFDRLVAMDVVDWPSILAMLHSQLPPDYWHRLVDHVGGPLGCELYVRGTMHSWASPPPKEARLEYTGGHHYRVTLLLMPGIVRFKIADANWTYTCNRGGREPGAAAVLGEAFELNCNSMSNDIMLDLSAEPAAQSYLFEVNAADPVRPSVTVSAA